MKYKLVHLHSDFKFLHDTLRYKDSSFYNEIIFIGEADDSIVSKIAKLQIKFHVFNPSEIDKMLEIISNFDGIVLYDLNKIKADILRRISPDIKVFLRLFGYELYSMKRDKFMSKRSIEISKPISLKNYSLKEYLKRRIKRELGLEYRVDKQKQRELYSRIDAILLLNECEYEDLSKYFYLPKFIQLSLLAEVPHAIDLSNKKNEIIVGNSRNSWNNHLDVFKIAKKTKEFKNYNFVFFFNYGSINLYSDAVKQQASSNTVFIEDFLDIEEFAKTYESAVALVINSYRQHALGNIFKAIFTGTKVYLNRKSSTYQWLKHKGFIISEISELSRDIDSYKIRLTQEEYQHNLNCYKQVKNNYTNVNFIENIITVLKNV